MRYYCIRCGMSFPNARDLLANNCPKGPTLAHPADYKKIKEHKMTMKKLIAFFVVMCEASQKRYPVPEFVEQFATMNSRVNL